MAGRYVCGDALAQLAECREHHSDDIGVGGASLATEPPRASLLDELLLFGHPTVFDRGGHLRVSDARTAPTLK